MAAFTRIVSSLPKFLLPVLLLSVLGVACQREEPIKVGFIAGTSGRVADLGISGRDAVQMLVEAYNDNGGINGRRIELVIKDDQQNPEIAQRSVQELIDAGVAAIIGPMTSDMAVAILPQLKEAKIPVVSPTASSQLLSGFDDYFFRVTSTSAEYATKSASYHLNSTDLRRLAAVFDEDNRFFTEVWLQQFKDVFEAYGGEIVAEIGFDSHGDRSFTEITQQVLASQAAGIVILANSMDSALLCQQIRKVDGNIPISLSDWGSTERLLELGGRAVEGVIVTQTFARNHPGEKYQTFRKEYLDRFRREPGFSGVYAYDAAQVVFTALRQQQSNQNLKEVLDTIATFPGLQGDFSFDEYGDVQRGNGDISVVRNQQFIVLE